MKYWPDAASAANDAYLTKMHIESALALDKENYYPLSPEQRAVLLEAIELTKPLIEKLGSIDWGSYYSGS